MGKVEGLLILLAIILILFGAKKLPELARGVGESVRELKRGLNGSEDAGVSKKDAAEEK
jgi:sec-independent protein translocase protein TatA